LNRQFLLKLNQAWKIKNKNSLRVIKHWSADNSRIGKLRHILYKAYEKEKIIYTSNRNNIFSLDTFHYIPTKGKLKWKKCLRYIISTTKGNKKRIPYDELLEVFEYYKKNKEFPDNKKMQRMLRLSCSDGKCCINVAKAIIEKIS